MMIGSRSQRAVFYASIAVVGFAGLALLPYLKISYSYSFYGISLLVVAVAVFSSVLFITSRPNHSINSKSHGTTQDNNVVMQINSAAISAVSFSTAALVIYLIMGKYYLILLIVFTLPVDLLIFMLEEKYSDFRRVNRAYAILSALLLLLILIAVLTDYFSPGIIIGSFSVYAVVRNVALLEPMDRIREGGYASAISISAIGSAAALKFLFSRLISSGIAVTVVLILLFVVFFSVMIASRRKRGAFIVIYSSLALAVFLSLLYTGYILPAEFFVPVSALAVASVYMINYPLLDSRFHNILRSVKLLPKGALVPVFAFFVAVGMIATSGIYQNGIYVFLPGHTFSNYSQLGIFLAMISVLIMIWVSGSRLFNPAAFAFLLVMFAEGVFFTEAVHIPGIWYPNLLEELVISLLISVLVLYEPTYRFTRSYTTRIPPTYSISHRLGITHYLHSRYDVNLEKNKRSNKDLLGSGGFAYVFKGKDVSTGDTVVIKVPRIYDEDAKTEKEKKEFLQDSVRQLRAEKDVLSVLNHPSIVNFIDFFKENNEYYLVEEFADGRTIDSFLSTATKQGTKFDEKKVLAIARRLLFALNYMHMHEVFHRDLNPGNIIITKQGPKIIDFGTSKSMIGRGTRSFFSHSQRIGVPCYNPPELEIGTSIEASPSYDTYAIGAIMCSLLTGTFLDGDVIMSAYGSRFINERYLESEIKDKVSPELFMIMKKMLAFRPEDRYESAVAVIADLFDLTGEMIVTHMGDIYVLDRGTRYSVILSGDKSLYVPEGRIIRDHDIFIYEHGRENPVKWGEIFYDNLSRGYYFRVEPKKGVYGRNADKVTEKQQQIELHPFSIYSPQQDVRSGSFSFHVRRE